LAVGARHPDLEGDAGGYEKKNKGEEKENLEPVGGEPDIPNLLVHPDLTDGGGEIVHTRHSDKLQDHVGLLGAAVDRLVDKGDGEAGGEASSAVGVERMFENQIDVNC